jgi:hypothetical protein
MGLRGLIGNSRNIKHKKHSVQKVGFSKILPPKKFKKSINLKTVV